MKISKNQLKKLIMKQLLSEDPEYKYRFERFGPKKAQAIEKIKAAIEDSEKIKKYEYYSHPEHDKAAANLFQAMYGPSSSSDKRYISRTFADYQEGYRNILDLYYAYRELLDKLKQDPSMLNSLVGDGKIIINKLLSVDLSGDLISWLQEDGMLAEAEQLEVELQVHQLDREFVKF